MSINQNHLTMTRVEQTINEAREKGISRISTCDAPNWSRQEHDDMLKLVRNQPADVEVSYKVNYGVHDWTLIKIAKAEEEHTPEAIFRDAERPENRADVDRRGIIRGFDAYQHFLYYFEERTYKEVAPHGAHLTQHFCEKLAGFRSLQKSEGNSPAVLVRWIQEMSFGNQNIMIDYMIKYHTNEDGSSKWGRGR